MCSHSQSGSNGNTVLLKDKVALNADSFANINDVLNCDTLKQVRSDILKGFWPEQCKRCEVDKHTGINSRNEWETKRHLDVFTFADAINSTTDDGTITDAKLVSLDLRIGNQCNLRCVMCFPGESTLWYKDYQEITGYDHFIVDDKTYNLKLSNSDFDWANDKHKIDLLVSNSKYLNKIKFGGGEPLLIKYHHYLLNRLIEEGYSENIELEYSVNLTIFPPLLFELWKRFKVIRICASVDAYGLANEAVRYPSKWETIEKNLRMLDDSEDNIIVFTSTTVSILTLEHYSDLMLWIKNQNYKKINRDIENPGTSHLVYNPTFFNINLLDEHQQNTIFDILKNKASGDKKITKKLDAYDKYCTTARGSMTEQYIDTVRKQFVGVFDRLALNQKQYWEDIFPIITQFKKSWELS
jgi:sulfatase maturation enzyme AslB (radical SAM superfamily)